MIYTTDIIGYQWDLIIKSFGTGILLGLCYDFLRVFRVFFRLGKRLFIASDFLFCVWSAFLTFSFLLNENFGMPRLYIFIGIGAGFFCWYNTLGRFNIAAAKIIKKVLSTAFSPVLRIMGKSVRVILEPLEKVKIIFKKTVGEHKRLLKSKSKMVYNILCLNISKAFSFCGEKAGKEPRKVESNGREKAEKKPFSETGSYCLRGISSHFTDIDPGEHQQETKRA